VGGVDSRPPRMSVVCSNTIGKVRTSRSSLPSEGRSWICRQVWRERLPRVADGGDPLTLGDGLAWAYQGAALLEVLEDDVAPTADVEDDRVAFALADHADRLLSEVGTRTHMPADTGQANAGKTNTKGMAGSFS
jgi:hypothetical protein